MKRLKRLWRRLLRDEFHDRAVVASLKLALAFACRARFLQFHDRAVVASLKQGKLKPPEPMQRQFHDRAVVASLKLPIGNLVTYGMQEIPRPRGRGLIEAG